MYKHKNGIILKKLEFLDLEILKNLKNESWFLFTLRWVLHPRNISYNQYYAKDPSMFCINSIQGTSIFKNPWGTHYFQVTPRKTETSNPGIYGFSSLKKGIHKVWFILCDVKTELSNQNIRYTGGLKKMTSSQNESI